VWGGGGGGGNTTKVQAPIALLQGCKEVPPRVIRRELLRGEAFTRKAVQTRQAAPALPGTHFQRPRQRERIQQAHLFCLELKIYASLSSRARADQRGREGYFRLSRNGRMCEGNRQELVFPLQRQIHAANPNRAARGPKTCAGIESNALKTRPSLPIANTRKGEIYWFRMVLRHVWKRKK